MADDRLERLLRATLREQAQQAPDPDALTRRVLDGLGTVAADPTDPSRSGDGMVTSLDDARARRRTRTRWLVPMASAASVAAVVVIGVTVAHRESGTTASSVGQVDSVALAPASAPLGGAAQLTNSPITPKAATPAESGPVTSQTPQTQSAQSVPASFAATDLSFDSPNTGFAVGSVACASDRCSALARLGSDGSWSLAQTPLPFAVAAAPATGSPTPADAVSHIRFATDTVGYAFGGSSTWVTADGGRTWTRAGTAADGLEVADGTAVRFADSGCTNDTCSYTISVAKTGSSAFATAKLPGDRTTGSSALLARSADRVFVVVNSATGAAVFASTDSGKTWKAAAANACGTSAGSSGGGLLVTSLSAASDGSVSALCNSGTAQFSATSTDGGETFSAGASLAAGTASQLSAASATTLLIGGTTLLRSTDAGRTWAEIPGVVAAGSTAFLGFQDPLVGRWVGGDGGAVWSTADGGASFTKHSFG